MGFYKSRNKINQEAENFELSSELDPELATQDLQDATQEINSAIDAGDECDALEADATDELQAVKDRLKSEEPIDPVEVAIVNESIQNYCKAIGIKRENTSVSLESIKNR